MYYWKTTVTTDCHNNCCAVGIIKYCCLHFIITEYWNWNGCFQLNKKRSRYSGRILPPWVLEFSATFLAALPGMSFRYYSVCRTALSIVMQLMFYSTNINLSTLSNLVIIAYISPCPKINIITNFLDSLASWLQLLLLNILKNLTTSMVYGCHGCCYI